MPKTVEDLTFLALCRDANTGASARYVGGGLAVSWRTNDDGRRYLAVGDAALSKGRDESIEAPSAAVVSAMAGFLVRALEGCHVTVG